MNKRQGLIIHLPIRRTSTDLELLDLPEQATQAAGQRTENLVGKQTLADQRPIEKEALTAQ